MIPPLWPWKVISLPFRGPRPVLKGEEPLELRLMDDIVIPHTVAQLSHPDRPPYASSMWPSGYLAVSQTNAIEQAAFRSVPAVNEPTANMPISTNTSPANLPTGEQPAGDRYTILVLRSNQIIEVMKYHRDNELLMFQDVQGRKGSVNFDDVDWRKTTGATSAIRSADVAPFSRQVN